jgi:hypothetical protein
MHVFDDVNLQLISETFTDFQKQLPPDTLYHYTDQRGLLGIIENVELWATKVQYMNDATEFGRAVDLAKMRLRTRADNTKAQGDAEFLNTIIDNLDSISHTNICSVSFCRNPDLLSQWRGYSGSGGGYAIGFCSTALIEVADNNDCRLGRCIYDETTQITIIDELIDQIVLRSVMYKNAEPYDLELSSWQIFENSLIRLGAFFKDRSFAEEDEWRLVTNVKFYGNSAFCFRPGRSMLIPYYCLKMKDGSWKNQIAQVMVGPCPHPQSSQMAVRGLLVSYHATTGPVPPVDISKIPYRSW